MCRTYCAIFDVVLVATFKFELEFKYLKNMIKSLLNIIKNKICQRKFSNDSLRYLKCRVFFSLQAFSKLIKSTKLYQIARNSG